MRAVPLAVSVVAVLSALAIGAGSSFAATSSTPYAVKKVDSVAAPQTGGRWSERLATATDLNGDGANEFYSAAPFEDVGGTVNQGRVYLHNGKDGSLIRIIDSPQAQTNAAFGFYISTFGDVNGDGKPEIAVGTDAQDVSITGPCLTPPAPEPNGCNEDQGKAWVFNGATGAMLYALDNPFPQGITGNSARFGSRIGTAGDVNNDGKADLLVGASNNDVPAGCGDVTTTGTCRKNQGQAFIFNGATGALIRTLDIPDTRTAPCSSNCGTFGVSVQSPGDTDGDGVPDQLVDAGNFNAVNVNPPATPCDPGTGCNVGQGRMYVFSGATGNLLLRVDDPVPQPGATFGFQDAAPNSPGDVNGDGRADLYANGFLQNGPNNEDGGGRAFVFSGSTGARLYTIDDPTPTEGGQFGFSMSKTDYNKDGTPDLYIGQSPHHVATANEDGGTYVFNGANGALLKSLELPPEDSQPGTASGPRLGWTSVSPGDLNGDGEPDYLGGAPFLDAGGNTDQGRLYMFLSGPSPASGGGGSAPGGDGSAPGGGGSAPQGQPPGSPPGPDGSDQPPLVVLGGPDVQRLGSLYVSVLSNKDATLGAGGTITPPRTNAAKTYRLRSTSANAPARTTVKLRLKLPAKAARAIKRRLRRGRQATARITVTATDKGGRKRTAQRKIKVVR